MTPRRIVILNDRSKAQGGATSLALLAARELAASGFEVVYVTGDSGEDAELPANVELVALHGKPLLELPFAERTAKGLYNRKAHDLVQKVISQFDCPGTVYHLHGWAQILSPAAMAALKAVEDRLVIHFHDFFHACPNGTYFNFGTGSVCHLKPLGTKCLATDCDKRSFSQKTFRVSRMLIKQRLFDLHRTRALLAIIHPFMADWLERASIDRSRMRVVRNPVIPFERVRVEAERNSEMIFVGRLEPEKGADLAIEAAVRAGRTVRVMGDGSEMARLVALYPEVIWEGWSSHEQISKAIRKARGLIMPSRLPEPFGLVALEALQSGIPLVAFPDSFIAQEAAQIGCAFLATDRQAGSLTRAVRMLDDDEVVKRASETAFLQTKALSSSRESWIESLLGLYRELLSQGEALRPHDVSSSLVSPASGAMV